MIHESIRRLFILSISENVAVASGWPGTGSDLSNSNVSVAVRQSKKICQMPVTITGNQFLLLPLTSSIANTSSVSLKVYS